MSLFVEFTPTPQVISTGWRYAFVVANDDHFDDWNIRVEDPDHYLHETYKWCEEQFGGHYSKGKNRFWFSHGRRFLFKNATDAAAFKLRWV